MSEVLGDWMEKGQSVEDIREDERVRGLNFAKLYEVFVQDPRGQELLKHWVESVEKRDILPGSSHAEYAYWEGRRAFIRGIQRQIDFARTEGRLPQ